MKQHEVIRHLCETVALAYRSIGDYSEACDCFCDSGLFSGTADFQHSGKTLKYVRQAVLEKLKADGVKIEAGFNEATGDPVN